MVLRALLEVYSWTRVYNKGDINKIEAVREESKTRRNRFQVEKRTSKQDTSKNCLLRVKNECNSLGSHVVSAYLLDTFKERLEKFMPYSTALTII